MTRKKFVERSEFIRAAWSRGAIAIVAASCVLSGCGGGSMFGSSSSDSSSSFGSRFSQLFGSGSDSKAELVGTPPSTAAVADPDCPSVAIREGTSTYAVGLPGREATASDLRFQGTIVRYARDCTRVGGQINARVGVEGRVIVGPAGAPQSVDLPIRVALVQEGAEPKTIATKLYTAPVQIGDQTSAPFSFVAEDLSYPVPPPAVAEAYVFYIGFDPNGAKPAKPERPVRKGKKG